MHGPSVVVIDDDLGVRQLIGDILQAEGARVTLAHSSDDGISIVRRESPEILFVDLRLPGRDGIATIEEIRRSHPQLPIVVITGFGSFESSVEALRLGVADYVTKPITGKKISLALARAIALQHRQREHSTLGSNGRSSISNGVCSSRPRVVAASTEMREVLERAARVTQVGVPVLIEGETGVGKQLIARLIHSQGDRASNPYIRLSCAAVREDHFEQVLFGKNVTGTAGIGVLEQACAGTLLLHNVTELPSWLQGQLLEVLQQGWFTRPGSSERVEIDVRVIATTSKSLQGAVARGEVLQELFYYLSIMPIVIPPLRHRREDIRPLVEHFVDEMPNLRKASSESTRVRFSKEAMNCLLDYHWPGNVRELANVVQRSAILATGDEIAVADFSEPPVEKRETCDGNSITVPLAGDLKIIERHIINEVIKRCQGNKAAAARQLGLHRKTLYRLLEAPISLNGPGSASLVE